MRVEKFNTLIVPGLGVLGSITKRYVRNSATFTVYLIYWIMDLLLSFQRGVVTSTALSFSSVVARASAGRHVRVRHLPVGLRLGENHRRPAGCAAQVWPHPPPGGTYRVDAANGESVAERPGAGSSLVLLPLLCITDLFQGSRHAFGRGQQRRARQPLGTSRALQYAPAILE